MGQTAAQPDVDLVIAMITGLGYRYTITGRPGAIVISAVDHERERPDPKLFQEVSGVKKVINIPVSAPSQLVVK